MNGHTPVLWDKEHKLWFARPGADLSMLDRWLPRPQEVSMNGSDPVTEFARVLENAGLVLEKNCRSWTGKSTVSRPPVTKKDKKVAHIAASLDGRPAGWYRDYRSADDSPVTLDFLRRRADRSPRKTSPESAFDATQGKTRSGELKAQYNRQAAYARRYVSKWPQATAHEYLTRKEFRLRRGCE